MRHTFVLRKTDDTRSSLNRAAHALGILILLWLIAAGIFLSPAMAQQSADDARWLAAEKPLPTAPVMIDGRVLFHVRGVTAFPAAQRAQAIAGRISDLAADRSRSTDSLHLVESDHSTDIVAGDRLIMSVFNADTRLESVVRRVLAGACLQRIKVVVAENRAERVPERLMRDTVTALGSTLLLALLLFAIFHTQRWLTRQTRSATMRQ